MTSEKVKQLLQLSFKKKKKKLRRLTQIVHLKHDEQYYTLKKKKIHNFKCVAPGEGGMHITAHTCKVSSSYARNFVLSVVF